ncbi:hypothetical protein Tco_0400943 [Tanacetum coccineum]
MNQLKALDDELVALANRLKIGKSNLQLSSNLISKEPTLQVVLDALKLTPFYKAFEITADVPDIYMQEFWILKIFPKLPGQIFEEPPLEEEILSFIRDLGYTGEIKFLSDVNVNHMHQPWRSFAAIINKCLSGKTTTLENLVYQVENKNSKKNNDMYYPRFTKVIVDYFMVKDQAIPRRNNMFWHYARDDFMFTTIRVISKHQDTQVYDAILPQHLTNQTMLESEAYKTYLAYATGEKIPKPKYVKNKADFESSPKKKTATTTKRKRLKTSAKAAKLAKKKQPAKTSTAKGLIVPSEKSSDEEDDDEVGFNDDDDDNDDDDQEDDGQDDEDQDDVNEQTDSDNDGDDFVHPKLSTQDQEVRHNEEESDKENAQQTNVQTTQVIEDTHVIITLVNLEGQQQSSSVSSGFVSNMLNPSPDIGIDSILNLNTELTSLIDVPVTTIIEPPLLLKTLENDFSEFKQTNQFVAAVSSIPGIVDTYLANKMNEAVKIGVQLHSDRLIDKAQAKNEDFLNKLDDNIKKIIKDQVQEQVKAQVSKILLKIKKTVNEQLEAEVLTRLSNESKTSHAVAANLFKLELKKILIDKMESNKSIHRSDEQKNLYKALVDAYESDKLIIDTYGDNVLFKRRRDDEDKDEEPSARSNRGSKRRKAGKEPESTSAPKEKTSKTTGKSTKGSKSHHKSTGESAQAEKPRHSAKDLEEPTHLEFETGVTEDQPDEETSQLPDWFQKLAKPPTPDCDWNKTLPDAHGPV